MNNPFYHRYKQLLPVSIWCIFSLLAAWGAFVGQIDGNTRQYLVLNQFHYIGFILLGLLIISFFFFRPYYKYVVIFAVFAGIFDIACFSGSDVIFKIGGKNSQLTIQPLSLLVALAFFLINFERIRIWFVEKNEPVKQTISHEEKNAFIEKYEHISDEELYAIRDDRRYVPAARVAAESIIAHRIAKRCESNTGAGD